MENNITTDQDCRPLIEKENETFSFSCPHCGQKFDCIVECHGRACICPACNKTIYPIDSNKEIEIQNSDSKDTGDGQNINNTPEVISDMGKALVSFCDSMSELCSFKEVSASNSTKKDSSNPIFDNDDIDWDQIDMDMLSDRDDAINDYIDDYTDSEEFEKIVLQEWREYRASSSFSEDFDEYCDTYGHDKDGFALDCMKDEWISDWKCENDYDWLEEHREELEDKWKQTKESDWRKQWAENHAATYNVSVEELLLYWNLNPIASNPFTNYERNITMTKTIQIPRFNNRRDDRVTIHWHIKEGDYVKQGDIIFAVETDKAVYDVESKFQGTALKLLVSEGQEVPVLTPALIIGYPELEQQKSNSKQNKIPVETFFKKASGKITARFLEDKLILYCDLYTDNTEKDQYQINFDFIAYDEDDDICGRYSTGMCWLKEAEEMEIIAGCVPVKLIVREK